TFGAKDLRTLYVTAGTSVYKIRLNAVGFLTYPPADSGLAEFAAIKDVKSVLLSPDGRELAFVVAVTDLKANRVRTQLRIAPTAEGEARQLALETEAIEKVLWSPKGDQLAVVGATAPGTPEKDAGTYLWVVDPASGKGKRLTRIERSNHYLAHQGASLCWSPDGASLAYLAADPGGEPASGPADPVVVTRVQYKTRTALSDNRPTHVWTVEAATGQTRRLT